MMNLLSAALLLSSLAAASLFSPFPEPHPQLLREAHRVVVVEFERHVPPPPAAGEIPPNAGELRAQPSKDELSDAFEKSSSLLTHAKNRAAQFEETASNAVKSASRAAVGAGESAAGAAKSAAGDIFPNAGELLSQPPKEELSDAFEKRSSLFTDAKNKAVQFEQTASNAVKSASRAAVRTAAGAGESAAGTALKAGEDVAGNISASAVKSAAELRRNVAEMLRVAWGIGRRAAKSAASVAHLLGFATAYGTCVWITFASSHVLASALPRQQFGVLQSRLYPVYFRVVAFGIGAAIAGHVVGRGPVSGKEKLQGYNLMAMLATVLLNLFWLEPRASKAMFQRMKLEKEEGRGMDSADVCAEPAEPGPEYAGMPAAAAKTIVRDAFAARKEASVGRMTEVKKRLKRLNNYSSFLNVLTLMGLSWHLVHLAQRLGPVEELCK